MSELLRSRDRQLLISKIYTVQISTLGAKRRKVSCVTSLKRRDATRIEIKYPTKIW